MAKVQRYMRALLGSTTMQNQGSLARDLLANERTFLAWLRTSLNTAALGIVLAKLADEFPLYENFAKTIGAILIVLGMLFMLTGVWRQVTVHVALEDGHFPSPAWLFTTAAAVTIAVLCVALALIIVSHGMWVPELHIVGKLTL